jgi:hypothetical protein
LLPPPGKVERGLSEETCAEKQFVSRDRGDSVHLQGVTQEQRVLHLIHDAGGTNGVLIVIRQVPIYGMGYGCLDRMGRMDRMAPGQPNPRTNFYLRALRGSA